MKNYNQKKNNPCSSRNNMHDKSACSPNTHPKILKRNYHITSQTAYHISELAFMENTSEGRIIDKLMRLYLATQTSYKEMI